VVVVDLVVLVLVVVTVVLEVVLVVVAVVVVVVRPSSQSTARPTVALKPVMTSSKPDPSKFERRILPLHESDQ
jgi:hypothetical protein